MHAKNIGKGEGMRRHFNGKVIFCLVVVLLAALPLTGQTEKQKIKVVVENATIRANPDLQSNVINQPALGAMFEVEKRKENGSRSRLRLKWECSLQGIFMKCSLS